MGRDSLRVVAASVFLAFQLFMVGKARFDPARCWCWAPHDAQNEYRIAVRIDNRLLPSEQVGARYRIRPSGVDPRAIEHVLRLVRQYEETYGAKDDAEVEIRYRTNGGPWQSWHWPAD